MARYVALLRAINVGGHTVKMDHLHRLCEGCGLRDVTTVIASGNVLFTSRAAPAALERTIAGALEDALGYTVATFVRTPAQMTAAAACAPLGPDGAGTTYVGFLERPLDAAGHSALARFTTPVDRFASVDGEVYWRCAVRSSDSTFAIKKFEKAIGQSATFRNVTTVRKIAALLAP